MMEAFELTHSYYRFPNEVPNRLDVLFNDTIFDVLFEFEKCSNYPFKNLREVVGFRKEMRNPKLNPREEFIYTDIGSIDIEFGEPAPSIMRGEEANSSRMRQVMRTEDVLLSTTRPYRNAICITPDTLDNQICSTGFSVLIPKDVTSRFLFLALRSNIGNLQLQKLCSGSGYPAINQEIDVPTIRIPCPGSFKEQERIVNEIKPIEDLAKSLKAKAIKLQNEAINYLLEKLHIKIPENPSYFFKTGSEKLSFSFGIEFDVISDRIHYLFYHPKYKILEDLKAKYRTVNLGSIITTPITRGEQPIYDENGDNIVIKTVDIKDHYIRYEDALKVNNDFFNSDKCIKLIKGDILLASTGYVSMGKINVYDRDETATVDGHISVIRINDNYDPYFVTYYLRSYLGQIQIEKFFTGSSGQIELQPNDINSFILPSHEIFPKRKQKEIATVIKNKIEEALSFEQSANEKRLEAKKLFESLILK